MPNTVYKGPSTSQSTTYEAVGVADDYSDVITNIAPEVTHFLSNLSMQDNQTNIVFGWFTEGLQPPTKNAYKEDEDYTTEKVGSTRALENNVQFFRKMGYVTDAQKKVKKMYEGPDEFTRQVKKAFTGMAQDIEYAIVNNDARVSNTATTAPEMGGIPFFMSAETIEVSFGASNKVTSAQPHTLDTGDFVYLNGTLPSGLSKDLMYYIRKDDTTPDTVFTLHDTQKSAVENGTPVSFSSGGSATMLLNNIVDLEDKTSFTVADINTAMEMAYKRGGNPTEIVMSPRNKVRFSQIAGVVNSAQRSQKEKKVNQVVDVLECDFGTVTAVPHRLYADNRIDLFDPDYHGLGWFDRPHEVKGLAKKGSREEFVLEAACGYKALQPKASASILNSKRV